MEFRAFRYGLCILILLVSFTAAASAKAAQGESPEGAETLALLQKTIVPSASRVDLARRLLGIKDIPENPTQPLKTYQVGDEETFWVSNSDTDEDFQVTAKLVYATPHVFMWFESDARQPSLKSVQKSADKFEKSIYPTTHSYFGVEDSPGVDGDVHLYILHARNLGSSIAGYFSSSSEYPKVISPHSNQAQMFLVNLDNAGEQLGTSEYEGVLAHEFQHMIHDHTDPNEETWLNEGLSELSRLVNGYADTGFAPLFLDDPRLQLNTWSGGDNGNHYGASYLFTAYFLQRFGKEAVQKLVAEPENGLTGVNATLTAIGATDPLTRQPITVIDLYADWQMANLLNDKKIGDGRYVYTQFNERLPKISIDQKLNVGKGSDNVNQFGTQYLELSKAGTYTFTFKGTATVPVVGTTAHSGRYVWWSNRADKSDTSLTHEFDLSSVKSATLSYWTWYSIERGWDYAYVAVSEDGESWTALPTARMLDKDPHGNAWGPGYSGASGTDSEDDNAVPLWVQEKLDLSAYTGKKIKVRFEMVTDDALSLPGLLIDDVSIPELNYSSDFETDDGGWVPDGFVRMNNLLPQQYLIQQVTYEDQTTVQRLLNPNDGIRGKWTLTVGGNVKKIVLAISGVTEYTTEPAPYTYEVTKEASS